jgi:hypothetical protein
MDNQQTNIVGWIASVCVILTTIWFFSKEISTDKVSSNAETASVAISKIKVEPVKEVIRKGNVREDIVRVLCHKPDQFSVFVMDSDKSLRQEVFYQSTFHNPRQLAKIICDAPIGKSMWYEGFRSTSWGSTAWEWVEIHIHSGSDINGGGWDEGKFGTGQTTVVK